MLHIGVELMTALLSIVIKIMDCLKNALDARAQHEATPPWINLYRDGNSCDGDTLVMWLRLTMAVMGYACAQSAFSGVCARVRVTEEDIRCAPWSTYTISSEISH